MEHREVHSTGTAGNILISHLLTSRRSAHAGSLDDKPPSPLARAGFFFGLTGGCRSIRVVLDPISTVPHRHQLCLAHVLGNRKGHSAKCWEGWLSHLQQTHAEVAEVRQCRLLWTGEKVWENWYSVGISAGIQIIFPSSSISANNGNSRLEACFRVRAMQHGPRCCSRSHLLLTR